MNEWLEIDKLGMFAAIMSAMELGRHGNMQSPMRSLQRKNSVIRNIVLGL